MEKTTFEKELERKGTITYTCRGVSMLPLLRQQRDLFTITKRQGRCQKYDVALYKRADGAYVILGDNCLNKEYGIADQDILGVMTSFVRDGREYSVQGRGYRLYARIWLILYPVRRFADKVRNYMVSRGYTVESFGQGNHDVYEKEPVYNFKMHRALYGAAHDNNWETYDRDVKNRLLRDAGSSFGYHMTAEDFYVYIICHGYKHYKGSGTGIQTLLDFYVFLKSNEGKLDFSYIETECEKLKIADFEKESRTLCQKVFGISGKAAQTVDMDELQEDLSESEQEMLAYYISSGVYGTTERGVKNRMKQYTTKDGKTSKVRYVLRRLFPGKEVYQYYPFVDAHKWILPGFYIWRMIRLVFVGERRERILREVKIVRKVD